MLATHTHTTLASIGLPPPFLVFFGSFFFLPPCVSSSPLLSRVSKSRGRNESVTLVELNQGSGTFVICGVHLDVESSCGGGGSGATDNNVTNIITLPHRDIF
jgi:hypothetical protein